MDYGFITFFLAILYIFNIYIGLINQINKRSIDSTSDPLIQCFDGVDDQINFHNTIHECQEEIPTFSI